MRQRSGRERPARHPQGHARATILARAGDGIWLNEHIEADGEIVYRHACKLGLEGIVNKRKDSPYRAGGSPDWLKVKNPWCEAAQRWPEEDRGKLPGRGRSLP